ncbi:Uma2 family endonuclease [uncultured Selenomonas sp.]|uniref:Uma2 family endonuclease n=1 Tax=uncultured Selenomonas sp. TaxID=159275 RepID=UPI0025E59DA0|nr:Uma2 family endonuclease [uncultured Selenomonas sp.]
MEKIDGKIVMMSPRPFVKHNIITTNISRIFGNFLVGKPCVVFGDGVDVHLDEKNTFIPDVMIVCNQDIIHEDAIYGAPDLVVEVLSPSTMRRDRTVKMKKYAAAGVREYWTFELDEVYVDFTELELKAMDEEERQAVKWQIKVSLYDDLFVDVKEVFEKV